MLFVLYFLSRLLILYDVQKFSQLAGASADHSFLVPRLPPINRFVVTSIGSSYYLRLTQLRGWHSNTLFPGHAMLSG